MKKKGLAGLLTVAMVAGIMSAGATVPVLAADEVNVTFCISHMANEWAVTAANSMEEAAKEQGVNLTVVEAGQDINKQVSQIESAVSRKMDAIILEPVSTDGVLAAVKDAEDAGVPIIVYNQNISDPARATTFVGASNVDLGYMEMKRACDDLGGKGNVALLLGPRGSEGQLGRSAGYEKALAEYPDVKVVFEEEAAWTTEDALVLAENWLQTGTEINAFVSQNDNMALGAVKAIEDKNLSEDIKVYGLDAVTDALKAVKNGRLVLTVSQCTEEQSAKAIEAAKTLAEGGTVEPEILVEGAIIDSSNVDEYIK